MAGRISDIKDKLNKTLHDPTKPWTKVLDRVESRTGVDRLFVFLGAIGFLGFWLAFGYAAQLICNFIGLLYPAYVSIHAIESKQKDDDTKWLTYWVVYATWSVFDFFADFIVSCFPFYWLLKCVFLMFLMAPTELNGSIFLYKQVIKPYFLKNHAIIDDALKKAKESAHNLLDKKN